MGFWPRAARGMTPGLPDDLAAQLRGFSEDGTLPIPVLTGAVESSTTEVGGNPATVIEFIDLFLAETAGLLRDLRDRDPR